MFKMRFVRVYVVAHKTLTKLKCVCFSCSILQSMYQLKTFQLVLIFFPFYRIFIITLFCFVSSLYLWDRPNFSVLAFFFCFFSLLRKRNQWEKRWRYITIWRSGIDAHTKYMHTTEFWYRRDFILFFFKYCFVGLS